MSTLNTAETRDPHKLKPHKQNAKVYGDDPNPDFLASCADGIETPLIITGKDVVVSGHKRLEAAIVHGLTEVPVFVRRDLTDETDIQLTLLRCNEGRKKTVEQRGREFVLRAALEKTLAQKRMRAGKKGTNDPEAILPQGRAAQSGDIAAKSVGMTRHTAEAAAEVVEEIDAAEASGDRERAGKIRVELNRSIPAGRRATRTQETPAVSPVIPTDQPGTALPVALVSIFETRPEFAAMMRACSELKKQAKEMSERTGGAGAMLRFNEFKTAIENARSVLKFGSPYAICPYCNGTGRDGSGDCRPCLGNSWVGQLTYSQAPKENGQQ